MNPSEPGAPATASHLQELLRASQGRWALDPAGSSAQFQAKQFWGAITVHGHFERLEGEGTVAPDGTVSGAIHVDAASLTTKNNNRDKHLRSADFFDSEHHPNVTITVTGLSVGADEALAGDVRLEAAGRSQPVRPVIQVVGADDRVSDLACRSYRRPDRVRDDLEPARDGRPPGPCGRHRPFRTRMTG